MTLIFLFFWVALVPLVALLNYIFDRFRKPYLWNSFVYAKNQIRVRMYWRFFYNRKIFPWLNFLDPGQVTNLHSGYKWEKQVLLLFCKLKCRMKSNLFMKKLPFFSIESQKSTLKDLRFRIKFTYSNNTVLNN